MSEPASPVAERPPAEEAQPDFCPSCGAAYEPLQEYCLECGERLPTNRGMVGMLATQWQRRLAWYPGDWIWPTLAFLLLAVAATAVAVAAGSRESAGSGTLAATGNNVTVGPGVATQTVATTGAGTLPQAPQPTIVSGTLPKPPGAPSSTTPTTPKPPPPANPNALAAWPAGKSGYTVVLESIPTSRGRAFAESRARVAKRDGLTQVGVIDTSNYSSLHAGYYAVFAGIYSSSAEASAAVATARARGFPDAFPRQVTR